MTSKEVTELGHSERIEMYMRALTKIGLGLMLLLAFTSQVTAQVPVVAIPGSISFSSIFSSTVSSSVCVSVVGSGAQYHQFSYTALGTVSAGAVKLQKSAAADCSSPSDLIGAVTVTSSNITSVTTDGAVNYIKFLASTPITGSGTVVLTYYGFVVNPVVTATVVGGATSANQTNGNQLVQVCNPGGTPCLNVNPSGPVASSSANAITCDTTVGCGVALITTPGKTVTTQAFSGTATATIQSGATGIMGLAVDSGANTDDTWVVLFNATSGSVTLGATAPKMIFKIPGGTAPGGGGNDPIPFGQPLSVDFDTALSWACLKTSAWGSTQASSSCNLTIQWKH